MDPTYGDMSIRAYTYNFPCQEYDLACLFNVAPCERVMLCVRMDKQTYNDRIFTNETTGTFDINFSNFQLAFYENHPKYGGDAIPIADQPSWQSVLVDNNDVFLEWCIIFRIPEDWASSIHYVNFTFVFNLVGTPNYSDYIQYPVTIMVNDFVAMTSTIEDNNGDPISANVCPIDLEFIRICLVPDPALIGETVIWALHPPVGGVLEHDPNMSDCADFPQIQNNSTVLAADNIVSPNGDACINLDPNALIEGENCVKLIVKPATPDACPPCVDETAIITSTITHVNALQVCLVTTIDFSGITGILYIEINGQYYQDGDTFKNIVNFPPVAPLDIGFEYDILLYTDDCAIREAVVNIQFPAPVTAGDQIVTNIDLVCGVCGDACTEVCDYTSVFEETKGDITWNDNGTPTALGLPGAYNPTPAGVAQLLIDFNNIMDAMGLPNVTMVFDDLAVPEELTIFGSCIELLTFDGANPTNFVQSNCQPYVPPVATTACDQERLIRESVQLDDIELIMPDGSNSLASAEGITLPIDMSNAVAVNTLETELNALLTNEGAAGTVTLVTNGTTYDFQAPGAEIYFTRFIISNAGGVDHLNIVAPCILCTYMVEVQVPVTSIERAFAGLPSQLLPLVFFNYPYSVDAAGATSLQADLINYYDTFANLSYDTITVTFETGPDRLVITVVNSNIQLHTINNGINITDTCERI